MCPYKGSAGGIGIPEVVVHRPRRARVRANNPWVIRDADKSVLIHLKIGACLRGIDAGNKAVVVDAVRSPEDAKSTFP